MGFVLDQIIVEDVDISETIDNDYNTEALQVDRIEGPF